MVYPKKFLGQHFLKDQSIAAKIVDALILPTGTGVHQVVEIGPGTGVLTQFLATQKKIDLTLIEIDRESVDYLKQNYPDLQSKLIEGDFLELDLDRTIKGDFSVIGNFPYNISSQILFKVLAQRNRVKQVVCMLQKEVADRIVEKEGSKTYGILSVLLQAYYDIEYLFKVPPSVFFPPPKVMSAVIRLERNQRSTLGCDEELFKRVVKQGFQNRRKILRNSLKPLGIPPAIAALPILEKRAEQLSIEQFILLTQTIEQSW